MSRIISLVLLVLKFIFISGTWADIRQFMTRLKRFLHRVFHVNRKGDRLARFVNYIIIALILISVGAIILETYEVNSVWASILHYVDLVSVIVFSLEIVCRVYSADLLHPRLPAWKARVRYSLSFMAIIDVLSVAHFYLPRFYNFQSLRVLRIFKLMKLSRYSRAGRMIVESCKRESSKLILSVGSALIFLVISSILIYQIEHAAQPEAFNSIPTGFHWAVSMLTVGSEIYPVTFMGKVLGSLLAITGIGIIAIPTAVIASGFEQLNEERKEEKLGDDSKELCKTCSQKLAQLLRH